MPLPLAAALGIGLGGAAITGAIGAITGSNQARKTRAHQSRLAQYQWSKDLEMWKMNNEYNSPQAQMQRLKEAGLNPALVYGKGAVGNTSGQIPKYQAYDPKYHQYEIPQINPLGMLERYQDVQNKRVVHDNLGKQGEVLEKEAALKTLTGLKVKADTAKSIVEKNKINAMIKDQVDILNIQLKTQKAKMYMIEKDWQNYKKYGIRPSDNIMWRGLSQMWEGMQSSKKNKTKELVDHWKNIKKPKQWNW